MLTSYSERCRGQEGPANKKVTSTDGEIDSPHFHAVNVSRLSGCEHEGMSVPFVRCQGLATSDFVGGRAACFLGDTTHALGPTHRRFIPDNVVIMARLIFTQALDLW